MSTATANRDKNNGNLKPFKKGQSGNPRGRMNPTAQTARALAAYTSRAAGQPQLLNRILAELQGTEQSQAGARP